MQDCKHRPRSGDDSASQCESQAGWNFRKGQVRRSNAAGKIEPLEALPGQLPSVDITKRALPGLEFITGVFSGVCQTGRPDGQPHTGQDKLLLWINISCANTACRGAE